MAQPEDSGAYHCVLPDHRRTVVHINVQEETCQELSPTNNLKISYTSRSLFLGTVAQFSCSPGYELHGPPSIVCLNGGRWSKFPPRCTGKEIYHYLYFFINAPVSISAMIIFFSSPMSAPPSRRPQTRIICNILQVRRNRPLFLFRGLLHQQLQHSPLWSQWKVV